VCSGALICLFSPTWDAVKFTLKVGFICPGPFVVDDPTDLGATIVVAQALCLTIFNLSPTQKTCHFTDGNKASVYWRRQPHSCLAFTVARRHFSCFPFAQRRLLCRCADSVCDKLTRQGTVQMQPSALPVDDYSWKPRSICSSGRHHHACCACPSAGCAVKATRRRLP